MHSNILLSLGIFHEWLEQPHGGAALNAVLRELIESHSIDGVEVAISFTELEDWICNLKSGLALPKRFECVNKALQEALLKLPYLSIHLDSFDNINPGQASLLLRQFRFLSEKLGVKSFTFHPDTVAEELWVILDLFIANGIPLSLENMDSRKISFRELSEIEQKLICFPGLFCTFDCCHWLENNGAHNSALLETFLEKNKSRIDKIHFSVPESNASFYSGFDFSQSVHFLNYKNGKFEELPVKSLCGFNTNWVIEGSVPLWNKSALLSEIAMLRKFSQANKQEDGSITYPLMEGQGG